MTDKLVVLLDMDCFYVQVEERHYPHIKGLPAAVVQYNSWKGGGIIAVNYEARAFGVKRGMRGDEARSKCSNIELVTVPVNRGKADLTRYRDAGKEVINVLCDYSDCVERASIDEAYIDFTDTILKKLANDPARITSDQLKSTWVVGYDTVTDDMTLEDKQEKRKQGIEEWLNSIYGNEEDDSLPIDNQHPNWDNFRLAHLAVLCEEMRAAVLDRTGFKCSAGIAHNKMLGKLSCGLHKPNQQTVLPQCKVDLLWNDMPLGKVRNLGGKLGDSIIEDLNCNTMGDLGQLSLQQLMARFDTKTAQWLYNLGKGIDTEVVTSRQLPKSIGCGKNFQGKEALNTKEKAQKWMFSLAEELTERLDEDQASNKRRAKTLTVSVRLDGDARFTSMSRSANLPSYCADKITRLALSLIQHANKAASKSPAWVPAIKNISLSAGKFEDWTGSGSGDIQEMFRKAKQNPRNNLKDLDSPDNLKEPTTHRGTQKLNDTSILDDNTTQNIPDEVNSIKKSNATIGQSIKSKNSPLVSNSFFRNLLQRRDQCTKTVGETKTRNDDCEAVDENQENNNDNENEDNSDCEAEESRNLDLLVSALSDTDDEKEIHESNYGGERKNLQEENSDSIYNDDTDIDSSFSPVVERKVQLSQDLFDEEESIDKDKSDLNGSSNVSLNKLNGMEDFPKKVNISVQSKCDNGESEETSHVSVEELFPNLDNVDESLLSMLPKEMKLAVEKALKDHKAKCQPKKSGGLWKYVQSIPSPIKKVTSNITDIEECRAGPSKRVVESSKTTVDDGDACEDENRDFGRFKRFENTGDDEESNSIDKVKCEECNRLISPFDVPEHADYHMALNLESDLRKVDTTSIRKSDKPSIKTPKTNRGKKRTKVHGKLLNDSKIQKLDSFFK